MVKANKILKIVTISAVAIASIMMIVFAIINMVEGGDKAPEAFGFCIIASVILIVSSILLTGLVIAKDPRHFDARLVVYNGLLLGGGVFAAATARTNLANEVVGYLVPSVLIGIGVFFVIATIVSLINKINSRSTDVVAMILGVLMIVIGIVLMVYVKQATRFLWLIIGVILLVYSIIALVGAIKSDKVKTIDTTEN